MFSRDSPATADNRKRFYERVEGFEKRTRRWPLYALRIAFKNTLTLSNEWAIFVFYHTQLICLTMNTLKCIKHQKDGSLLQTHTAALRRLGGLNSSRYTTLVLSRTPAKLLELGEAPECELHCKEMLLPATTAQREAKHASRFH